MQETPRTKKMKNSTTLEMKLIAEATFPPYGMLRPRSSIFKTKYSPGLILTFMLDCPFMYSTILDSWRQNVKLDSPHLSGDMTTFICIRSYV